MKIILGFLLSSLFLLQSQLFAELIDEKIENEALQKYGEFAKNRFVAIDKKLLKELKDASDIKKLNFVNTWVNGIKYKSDQEVYGVNDYWATLYEFVGKNAGDCEDYTIAKYYILKELGGRPKETQIYLCNLQRQTWPKHLTHGACISYNSQAKKQE